MSHTLPPQPNFEWLRKRAKAYLANLRDRDPATPLADAQQTLAHEYGFRTWAELKRHVQSLAPSPFASTWQADYARSVFPPQSDARAQLLRISVAGDEVTIVDVAVDTTGPRDHTMFLTVDGCAHAWGPHGFALTARWQGPRSLEIAVTRLGKLEGRVRYDVDQRGRELTLRYVRWDADERVAVFERRSA